jgi:hypothetical protein
MPWLSMWHDTADEEGMEAHTLLLMAKFGITSMPALVLFDKHKGLIYVDAWDKCVADPKGRAFPWPQPSQFPRAADMSVRADTAPSTKRATPSVA